MPAFGNGKGRGLLFCLYCHAYEVRDQPIGVLGTHPGAVRHALLLRQWSHDVVFFAHTLDLGAEEREQLAARGIVVAVGTVKRLVTEGDRLRGVELAEGHVVPRSAVFVFPRMVPHDALLTGLGCERDDSGWVTTDDAGRTSVSGVWAVCNVSRFRRLRRRHSCEDVDECRPEAPHGMSLAPFLR
ncbi:FAD-dependent oxidoreductase [Streptomyces sp. NBC_01285]|uniref:FAD-dependent oxidoreductase n=2 Tax=Streptomyces TaxID=1883 RepID=UPI002B1D50B1|nr:FAD-dependent oxidoreductase [Streptomyces sp. NBC_01285]